MGRNFIKHPSNTSASTKVQAAHNYGGAFDIDSEMFFTKDDLDELTESVMGHIQEAVSNDVSLSDAWIDGPNNQTVHVEVDWAKTGCMYAAECLVDMRKIKRPSDLRDKYALPIASDIIQQMKSDVESYKRDGVDIMNSSESTTKDKVISMLLSRVEDAVIYDIWEALKEEDSTLEYSEVEQIVHDAVINVVQDNM